MLKNPEKLMLKLFIELAERAKTNPMTSIFFIVSSIKYKKKTVV